jgi:4-hydroxy-2-oxoheptanedioate aldolase
MADQEMARKYLEAGAQFVAVGVDTTLLVRSATALANAFKGVQSAEAGSVSGRVY